MFCFSDIFSLGFGPFRWVCASGEASDLELTDRIACETLQEAIRRGGNTYTVWQLPYY